MQTTRFHTTLILAITLFSMTSCVSRKSFLEAKISIRYLKFDSLQLNNQINTINTALVNFQQQASSQEKQIDDLQHKNEALNASSSLTQMELTKSKKDLQDAQQKLIQLQSLLNQQSEELARKMTDALSGFNANDLTVTQRNDKVYVSLNENLFPSGSTAVNQQGKNALGKLATVLNADPDININIEGHTDRSTSIAKILAKDYSVDPLRVIASTDNEYDAPETNSTAQASMRNRRTEIILSPKLDELYKLLEQ